MLSIENLSVSYGDILALRNVSMDIAEKQIVSLVGSNGAGKTTLLMTISGILRPVQGRIIYQDMPIHKFSSKKIVEAGIAHVPEGRQLFPSLTVMENLLTGARFARAKKALSQTLQWIFSLFPRIAERKDQKAGTLSGGEQQMLAIARGLIGLPLLIMLDEPSLGLAPVLVSSVFQVVRKINRAGTTVLLVEQNVYHSLKISDRGFVLENGEIKFSGKGEDLLGDNRVKEAYLGL